MLPETGKPVAVQATGFQNIDMLGSEFDVPEDTLQTQIFQAFRVQKHQPGISLPAARVVAEHAFGRAA
ncbi:hypothetical protein [Mesorhizobium sp. CN2-181]|uniref:hypothetical protein n=1 Tax=Mesorhizobium yinganensis TaxID=3157707 RepID=UPI0032B7CAE9